MPPAPLANRLALSDHIEKCLRELADNFPGFRVETIVDENGWGAVAKRDDVGLAGGRRDNFFSRLQIVVSPVQQVPRARHRRQRHGPQQGSLQPQPLPAAGDVDLDASAS